MREERDYMAMINTGVETGIGVKTRLETLYYFIYEMAQNFGVDDAALDSITKGILKRKVIKTIYINYFRDKTIVGRVTIDIDWGKHALLASTDYGATFSLDTTKSIRSQLTEVSDIIIQHVKKMEEALGVTQIGTSYHYVDELTKDEETHAEARKYMGHVPTGKEDVAIEKGFTKAIEFICDKLREVKIQVEHKK